MILRVWRAPVEADRVEPFGEFMAEELFPTLADDPGCLSVTTAVDRSTTPPEVVAVSTWTSMEAMRKVIPDDPSGVILDGAEAFLAGTPRIEHLDVLDHL